MCCTAVLTHFSLTVIQIAGLEEELALARDDNLKDEVQMLVAEVEHYKIMSNAESDSAKTAQQQAERQDANFTSHKDLNPAGYT